MANLFNIPNNSVSNGSWQKYASKEMLIFSHKYILRIFFSVTSFTNYKESKIVSYSVVFNSLWPHGLCSPPGSSVDGILQARILKWVGIPFSRGYSWPRDQTRVSCIEGRFFTIWATRESPRTHKGVYNGSIHLNNDRLKIQWYFFLLKELK